jgi:hypothetical protein
LGAILAAAVATAAALPSAGPVSGHAKTAAQNSDPLICHSEPIEGSRITHKVCERASQIAQQRSDARQSLDRMQGSIPVAAPMMGPMH